jgi:hypothetical protein
MTDIRGNERGMVLVICLFILVALSIIGAAAVNTTVTDTRISGNVRNIKQGYFLAEAGISHGGETLMQDLSQWESYETSQTLIGETSLGAGRYEVTIEDAGGDLRRRMVSTATTNAGTKTRIEAILVPDYSAQHDPGLFGCEGVELGGNVTTQSYSSSGQTAGGDRGHVGTSDADADIVLLGDVSVHGDLCGAGGLTLDSHAAVLGSGYANDKISMFGDASISGDAETGDLCSGCSGRVAGSIEAFVSPLPVESTACDPLDIGAIFASEAVPIATNNDNGELPSSYFDGTDSSFFIGGSDACILGITGQQKQYSFSSFTTDADARITIQGDVRLYVTGGCLVVGHSIIDLAVGGTLTIYVSGEFFCDAHAQINNSGRPRDLILYSDYPSADTSDYKLKIDSNTDLAAVVYAPWTAIEVDSNANLFGKIRGKYVYMPSNAGFWYDEDLTDLPMSEPTINGFSVALRRQMN